MAPSSPATSDTEVPIPSGRQKLPAPTHDRPNPSFLKRLAIFIALAILVLGCANSSSLVVVETPAPLTAEGAQITGPNGDELAAEPPLAIAAPDTIPTSTILQLRSVRHILATVPLPTPVSTFAPAPTQPPLPFVPDTPTAAPTSSPTATLLPPATDTPVPTATLAPTETPLPTATTPPTLTPAPLPAAILPPDATLTATAEISPAAGIQHVVIITVDGMRPDALEQADAPNLDRLITQGTYSFSAQTVWVSETLPSHASIVTGMVPEKHGITWGLPYIGWPGMNGPTLFSVAHDAGYSTAMIMGKEKMSYLALPGSVDQLFAQDVHDEEVKEEALALVRAGLPAATLIHFPDVDRVGHAYGWMSSNQLLAVGFADGLIGEIVAELDRDGYLANTLLIITSDHGGHGKRHGDDSPEDRTIPWLAVGPGVPAGVILYRTINTYDTAATALYALDLPQPDNWDGQPVLEIFPPAAQ